MGYPDQQSGPLAALISGEKVAAWALAEPAPHAGFGEVALRAEKADGGYVLDGTKTPVEAGGQADWFLVTAAKGTASHSSWSRRTPPG